MLNDKLFALLMVGISINSFGNVLCFDAFKDYPPSEREFLEDMFFRDTPGFQVYKQRQAEEARARGQVNSVNQVRSNTASETREILTHDGKYTAPEGTLILTARASERMRPNSFGVLELNGYNRIGTDAFAKRNDITMVNVYGVSSIGGNAFSECENLKFITFNGDLEDIGVGVCYACPKLRRVTMPDSVKFIDTLAFRFCPNLNRDDLMKNFKGSHFHPKVNKNLVKWYKRGSEANMYEAGRKERFDRDSAAD